jgi:hypothetical protein
LQIFQLSISGRNKIKFLNFTGFQNLKNLNEVYLESNVASQIGVLLQIIKDKCNFNDSTDKANVGTIVAVALSVGLTLTFIAFGLWKFFSKSSTITAKANSDNCQ